MAVRVGRPRGHESDLEALEPGAVLRVEQRMRPRLERKEPMREAGAEYDLELQALRLVHRHDLDRVAMSVRRFGVVGGGGEQVVQRTAELGEQRLRAVEPPVHDLDRLETFDR